MTKTITRWQHFQMDWMQPMLPVGTRAQTASIQCQPTGEVYVLASDHDAEIERLQAELATVTQDRDNLRDLLTAKGGMPIACSSDEPTDHS